MKTTPDNILPDFYKKYVNHVSEMNFHDALEFSARKRNELVVKIPESKGEYRYAEGKWSIKELLCHLMDAERIFAYRALRFARNDETPLHGFEENDYAPQANAHSRSIVELNNEMQTLRLTTLDLFKSFNEEMLSRSGSANGSQVSVINIAYIIAGHEIHHLTILKERYPTSS